MIKLYDHPLSGNCYKVRLLLSQANIEFETEVVDVFKGENKREKYVNINPAKKIPAINDDGLILWESNAILMYLCEKYFPILLPYDLVGRANAYKWLIYNKTSVDPYLAKARAIKQFYPEDKQDPDELKILQKEGISSLKLIDKHLDEKSFFVDNYSVVDIAFYPYIKLSYQGDIDLDVFPNIIKWITKVESTDNFVYFEEK